MLPWESYESCSIILGEPLRDRITLGERQDSLRVTELPYESYICYRIILGDSLRVTEFRYLGRATRFAEIYRVTLSPMDYEPGIMFKLIGL